MNSGFVFVLSIIAMALIAGVVQTYIKQGKKRPESDTDINEMIETITLLEERIRVLERIVTEKNVDLRQEIDRL